MTALAYRVILGTVVAALLAVPAWGESPIAVDKARIEGQEAWYDAKLLTLEGQGWTDVKSPFDRLPAKAEGTVRPAVWNLSRDSAGMCVRFATDSPSIHCHWSLTKANLAMPHMAATGVSGVDLYVKTDRGWRWVACGRPTAQENKASLVAGLPKVRREWMLYLPLYNGVTQCEIGVSKEATIASLPRTDESDRPLVFYGTSITHGACASRPGMVHTAILGRQLDRPVINLGFSGNGQMEPAVNELLAELDAAVYVIDCLPNMSAAGVAERTEPTVALLRKAHPTTPIVLVEDRTYGDAHLVASKRERNDTSRAALRAAYERLIAAGDKHLYYIEGEHLLGDDDEGTVDSSHPNDLGFMRQADAFAKVLGPLLGK
ncbi:MAG: SGNH/GDSL hydrolase family protein [Pirellulaceae bacterium]|nr:SGNH/GDSL hydrolase family protein [Pirellulaceae bacterium]